MKSGCPELREKGVRNFRCKGLAGHCARSSIDLATSKCLIHNIATVRHPEFGHTSVLKLVFQRWKSDESGNLSKCKSDQEGQGGSAHTSVLKMTGNLQRCNSEIGHL